jgi:predicted house-cleaning noncanonical NTP pyrophosphatase (MazG superfamily)
MKKWEVIGFSGSGKAIIFKKENKYIFVKSTLPKAVLVADIGVDARIIDKAFRDEILNLASTNGKKQVVYSLDEENWQKRYNFELNRDSKFEKYVSLEEYDKLPERLSASQVREILIKLGLIINL